jgi:hypothetical protein
MKTFSKLRDDTIRENNGIDNIDALDEGFLKTTSKIVIWNKVRSLSGKVKKAKTVADKLNLIASQNTYISALFLTEK